MIVSILTRRVSAVFVSLRGGHGRGDAGGEESGRVCVTVFVCLSLSEEDTDEVMLAGRNLGVFVGILTMTATWVGGGYINGSAEETFKSGLVWTQAPFGYSISLALG